MADASCVPASINNSDASARANPGRYSAINAEASTILRELREYQQRTVGLARAEYAAGRRAVVAQLPTGAGKTIVMSELARLGIAKGNRILIVVPLLELLAQTVSKLNDAGITDIRIIQADNDLGNPDASVVVASIQTLTTKRWMENPIQADLVIVDECFPAGALVDGRPIESLRTGDLVRSFNHKTQQIEMRAVRRLFVSRPQSLVTVHLTDGRRITCTAGHPFFDGADYTAAVHLKQGDAVYGASVQMRGVLRGLRAEDMDQPQRSDLQRSMQESAASEAHKEGRDDLCGMLDADHPIGATRARGSAARPRLLLRGVQARVAVARKLAAHGSHESAVCERANERAQSDAQQRRKGAGIGPTSGNETLAADSRREWHGPIANGSAASVGASRRMGIEPCGADENRTRQRVPEPLQARSRASVRDARSGDRWSESLCALSSGAGRKETGLTRVAWVDRVEIHERSGADGFGSLCPNDLVYNIEVDGNHNYFVDGVLVHNCHHGKARTHEQFLKLYAGAKLLGLTATVQRGDGQGLGDIFGALVVGATVKELQDLGHLVPCKVYAPSKILGSRELAQDPVDAYEQRTPGKKAIVFCSTVEHARKTAESFQQRGHRAKWVSGDSPDRAEVVQQYKRRDFDVLVNVSLFVEGFDDPETEVAILARRFTHVGSYLQALGRILRPFPGKTSAVAIDLCGSALVHGTPDLEREYSLTGKGISSQRQPIRQCQQCGGVFVSASAQSCPFCEFKLPALTRAQAKALGIRLEEVTAATKPTSWPMRAKRRGFCSSCRGPVLQGEWIVYSAASKQALHTRCAARKAAA